METPDDAQKYLRKIADDLIVQPLKDILARNHEETVRLLNGILLSIRAERSYTRQEILDKLADIDVSLNLIARELGRNAGNSPDEES